MTYRELPMIDVKEVLRRWLAGHSNRRIARETGIDRDTAARYVAVARELALPNDRELTEAEVHEVAQRVQARPLPDRSAEWTEIAKHKARISEWLERKRPLRLSKIHTLLNRDGIEASYDTLRRYAMQELGWHKPTPTVRLEDPPAGQEAQVDFGQMGRLLDYVQARGIFVDPARIRSPKDKARVENQVPYVRESWFDGETFTDLADARRSAEHWAREIAGARVHGTTRQVPREQFASLEKAVMLAAPTELFDVPLWVDGAKVHPDHHIQIAHALYSVPTMYLHKKVRARADKTTVRIYFGTELIKMHPRKAPGGRSTDTGDYPVGKAAYALRSVDALVAKAKEKGVHVGTYAERIVGGPLPWTRMRQAYALLR